MDKNTSTSTSSAAAVADSASAAANSKMINSNTNTNTTTTAAAAVANTTSVKLLIKASNQQFDDQIIESDLLWTVKQLKTQLSLVYPSKPLVSEQKLIYSGQLLNDTLLLKDVIRSYKDVYTQNHIFHLVCMQKSVPLSSANLTQKPKVNSAAMATSGSSSGSSNANASIGADGLRQRHVGSNVGAQQASLQQQQQQQQPQQMLNFAAAMNPQMMSQWIAAAQAQAHATASVSTCPPPTHASDSSGSSSSGSSNPSLPFGLPNQYAMHQAMATQQAAMYAWMQQAYAQYMDQCLRLTSAVGGNTNEASSSSGSNATAAAAAAMGSALPTMMNPFLQPMPGLGVAGTVVNPVIPTVAAGAATAPTINQQTAEQSELQQQQAQPEQQQQAAPAARFPNIVQEEQENRDWLDRFFSITRFAFFLTILYFNSSPLRCLIVVIIAGIIYLYHIGVLRLRQERNNNNINRNNNAAVADQIRQGVQEVQQAQAAAQEQQQEPNPNNPPQNRAAAAAAADAEHPNDIANATNDDSGNAAASAETTATAGDDEDTTSNSVISFVRTFVVTFFTSLLPETPAL